MANNVETFLEELRKRPTTFLLFQSCEVEFRTIIIRMYLLDAIHVHEITDSWLTIGQLNQWGCRITEADVGLESCNEEDDDALLHPRPMAKKPKLDKKMFRNLDFLCVICRDEPTLKNQGRFYNRICTRAHLLCHECLLTHQQTWLANRNEAKNDGLEYQDIHLQCPVCKAIWNPNNFEIKEVPFKELKHDVVLTKLQQDEERRSRWEAYALARKGTSLECHHCAKIFKSSSTRHKHVSYVHDEVRFPCPWCNKALGSKAKLKKHMIQFVCRPFFYCKICCKSFKLRCLRNRHEKTCKKSQFKRPCPLSLSNELNLSFMIAKETLEQGNNE